jgi:enamine deaminase RidA (YjgF/YER057c/UK114 family)
MEDTKMREISRMEISDEWADSHVVEAGDFVFISYCMGNEGQPIEKQIEGAFDCLGERFKTVDLTLESVVKMDCLFRDIMDLLYLGEIIKKRFSGKFPARKAFETRFIRDGICFQIDAIAFKG